MIYQSTDFHTSESAKLWTSTFDQPALPSLGCTLGGMVDQLLGRQTKNTIGILRQIELSSIENEIKNLCRMEVIEVDLPKPKTRNVVDLTGFPDRNSVSSFLTERLSTSNPQPVAIAYCEDVLRERSVRSVDILGKRKDCKNHHLSAVIGSRAAHDGKCEFLVRNSYGASCGAYVWPCNRGQPYGISSSGENAQVCSICGSKVECAWRLRPDNDRSTFSVRTAQRGGYDFNRDTG